MVEGNFTMNFTWKIVRWSIIQFAFPDTENDRNIENNLYSFVFLNVDKNLFIFVNNWAILFDYSKGVVLKTYVTMPGGDPRNYPSSGSAVLIPLKNL